MCETTNNNQNINNHIAGKCERLFLHLWENWGVPFASPYKIKDREYWNQWWDNNQYSEKQIYKALRNLKYAVDNGDYERKFISADPCKFIQGGMIGRGLSEEMELVWDCYHNNPDPNIAKLAGSE